MSGRYQLIITIIRGISNVSSLARSVLIVTFYWGIGSTLSVAAADNALRGNDHRLGAPAPFTVSQDPPDNQEICGSNDNRVTSNDPAIGRTTGGCTGWLISVGAGLTAGHCRGPSQQLQFSVPKSLSDGTPVNPPVEDQYPITYVDSANTGAGNDWAIFSIGPNSSGQTVWQRQKNFYRMSRDLNPSNVIETGFGVDGPPPLFGDGARNSDSQTQQTHSGPFIGENVTSPSVADLRFRIDDENGNSGSPVIDASNFLTIGIATDAGCTTSGGSNQGTSFENDSLENAIQTFIGSDVQYVDNGHSISLDDGTVFRPWDTVEEAVLSVSSSDNAVVGIVKGSYSETLTISKRLTLIAPVGTVTIGELF